MREHHIWCRETELTPLWKGLEPDQGGVIFY